MEQNLIVAEIERTLRIEASSISSLENRLDMDTSYRIVKTIADCRGKIIVSGCGTFCNGRQESRSFPQLH